MIDLLRRAPLHHVGVICPDREQADFLLGLLGRRVRREYFVEAYRALCLFTDEGPTCIELVVPDGGPLVKHNRGAGGIHHIALQVEDLRLESDRLRKAGIDLLEREPIDAGPIWINFISPISTRGLTIELVQPRPSQDGR